MKKLNRADRQFAFLKWMLKIKVAGGQWEDQKTKELLLDYEIYKFVSLFAKIK